MMIFFKVLQFTGKLTFYLCRPYQIFIGTKSVETIKKEEILLAIDAHLSSSYV